MVITPQTRVRLFTNIPIDPTYGNVLRFSSLEAQQEYFSTASLIIHEYTNFNYIDETRELRIPANLESLWNVNYIAYQNATFGNKWFYAFVDRMEYYSPSSTAIFFTIDEWQTWQFNLTFNPSFVEREHVNDDTIGINRTRENVELGDYKVAADNRLTRNYLDHWYVSVSERIQIAGITWLDPSTILTQSYLTGAYYAQLNDINPGQDLQYICNAYTDVGKKDEILAVFVGLDPKVGMDLGKISRPTALDGYTPRNNKLFTYPYTILTAFTPGIEKVYKFEQFVNSDPSFDAFVPLLPNAVGFLAPIGYQDGDLNNSIPISGYPIGATNVNAYGNWIAQNGLGVGISIAGSAMTAATGLALGSPVSVGGGLIGIASALNSVYEQSLTPREVKGTASEGNAIWNSNGLVPLLMSKTIRAEYARRIDDFFSMFGYKINRVKIPNLSGRQYWNYVKTIDANIIGNCPKDSIDIIKASFNKGITLWHTNSFNYGNLNNPIV